MANDEKSTRRKETWRDWIPEGYPEPADDELITREEMLDQLGSMGLDLPLGTLRHWEGIGILPAPIRRRHSGATRALYPPWMPHLVHSLATSKRWGTPAETLAAKSREIAREVITHHELQQLASTEQVQAALALLADRCEALAGDRPLAVDMTLIGSEHGSVARFTVGLGPDRIR